jgi:HD-GYP domain-containing protein (c-di-GMP phosphodiesterase class II)
MVKNIPHLAPAMAIIRHHHERWDGQGYPDGLAGSHIPQGARIVAVADSFDTMTSPQPYKPALSLQAALDELLRCAGSQFDPEVVDAFLRAWRNFKIQAIYASWNPAHSLS